MAKTMKKVDSKLKSQTQQENTTNATPVTSITLRKEIMKKRQLQN